eukprot:20939-Heterococcus_DN1.PRE.2
MALVSLMGFVIVLSTEFLQEQANEILFNSFKCVPLSSSDDSCTGPKRILWTAKELREVIYTLIVPAVAAADVPFAHLQSQANLFEPRKVKDDSIAVDDKGAVITGDDRDVK